MRRVNGRASPVNLWDLAGGCWVAPVDSTRGAYRLCVVSGNASERDVLFVSDYLDHKAQWGALTENDRFGEGDYWLESPVGHEKCPLVSGAGDP